MSNSSVVGSDPERKKRNWNDEKYRKTSLRTHVRNKSKRDCLRQPCQISHRTESNFERCKRLGLLKRNAAQDRLKKIQSNIEVKKKICDKIERLRESKSKERGRKSDVLLKNFLPDDKCLKYKEKSNSADARLKRIRAACLKKVDLETVRPSVSLADNKLPHAVVINSFSQDHDQNSKKFDRDSNLATSDFGKVLHSCDKPNIQAGLEIASHIIEESCDDRSMSMDVDIDFDEFVKLNTSQASNCSNNDSYWSNVAELNSTSVNKVISELRQESSYLARYDNLSTDKIINLTVPVGDLFIVVDTNIFLSHLNTIHQILKYGITSYESPTIVVPWMVIQEIDYLMKKNDPELSKRAKLANTFIYSCLKKKHPRFYGQSLQDFRENFENAVSIDDFILNYCLKLISLDNNVVLLTDDINLCNKSMVNQLRVFTKAEFEKCFHII